MNRRTVGLLVFGLFGSVAVALVGIVVIARQFEPDEYQGPPPGLVAPDAATIYKGPATPTWYSLADDRNANETIRLALTKPVPQYGPYGIPKGAVELELNHFFQRLGSEGENEHNDEMKACFDFKRYFEERIRLWDGARPGIAIPERRREAWDGGFHNTLNHRYLTAGSKHLWDRSEVLRVALTADGKDAIATVRHERAKAAPRVNRWRLTRNERGWRAYDFTLTGGHWQWHTVTIADTENGTVKFTRDNPDDGDQIGVLSMVVLLAGGTNADLVDEQLKSTRGKQLPPALAAWRAYGEGQLRLMRDDPAGAMPHLDEAVKADPHWPPPYIARPEAHNRRANPTASLAEVRTVSDMVGPWPSAIVQEVKALRSLNRHREANDMLSAGRGAFPTDKTLNDLARQV